MRGDRLLSENGDVSISLSYNSLENAKLFVYHYPLIIKQISDGESVEISINEAQWLIENLEKYIQLLKE